jgi:putative inorganic carbon (hco3(-)) transporter
MGKEIIISIKNEKKFSLGRALRKFFLIDKLSGPLGFLLLFLISALIGIGIAKYGMALGVIILVVAVAIPAVYGVVAYPRFGIIVFLVMAYLIMWFLRIGANFPLGTLMDGMEGLFILSLFINQRKKKDWSIFKGPVTTMILVWIIYNIIEVANPAAESRMAWLYTVRSVAVVMFMYFIFVYYITTKKFIRIILKLWIGLALFAAVYAFKQEHFGFFGFEENYLHSNPVIENLLFIAGVWRKFSIFSDPVAFAYNMVSASLLCIGLLTGPISRLKKVTLIVLVLFFLVNMLSSGTRGAFVLIPVALLFLAVLKYNKKVLAIVGIAGVFIAILIFIPTSNPTLYRFQSAFRPSEDASFNVRTINQKRIQPYILSHPLGGGLGATGGWGQRFAPNSFLANFPPDSGYVRVAVELGWVGLLIFCILMFTILKTGINNYYQIKDPELKSYCLACVLIIFALNIGNYPQEALVQFPSNVYFYLVLALIAVTMRLDKQQNETDSAGK